MNLAQSGLCCCRTAFAWMVALAIFLPPTASAAIGPPGKAAGTTQPSISSTQIVDAVGRPIEGVTILIQPKPETLVPESISETTATVTDSQGYFSHPPAEAGGTYFVFRKRGLEALAVEASRALPAKITMRVARTITGRVLDYAGKPVPNALVGPVDHPPLTRCLDHWEHRNPMPRQVTRAAADGSFRLTNVSIEDVGVQISAPGYTPRQFVVPRGETELKVALGTGGAILTGKIVGSKDRAPQGHVPVEAFGNNLVLYSHTDSQGTYAFDNMPTGTWRLRAAGGGPLSGTQSRAKVLDVTTPADVRDVPLVLNQGIMLAGRAIDALTSQPLAGINITLAGYAGRGAKAVLTDGDGTFAFENLDSLQEVLLRFDPVKYVYLLPGGAYRDYFDITQAGDTDFDLTTITLPLHRRLEVKGSVVDAAGKPVPDVEVRMQSTEVVTSTPSKSGPGPLEFFSYSNGTGTFHAGIYPPGRYKVWAQQETLVSEVEYIEAYTTAPARPLTLRLNQAATAGGVVTDSRDNPVTGAVVIAWPSDTAEPEEDPIPGRDSYLFTKAKNDGRFELTGLRGEPMKLRATHPAYVQPAYGTLDPSAAGAGTTEGLALKFPAGGEFAATVLDDRGVPLSRAEVRLEYTEGLDGKAIQVMTDEYGRAFAAAIPAQQIEGVIVSHPVFAPHESEGLLTLPELDYRVTMMRRGSLIANVTGSAPQGGASPEIFLLYAPAGKAKGAGDPGVKEPEDRYQQTARSKVIGGKVLFPNLPEGWYKAAYADSGAYAESSAVLVAAGSGDHEVSLTLPTGNHLAGLVKDKETGKGVAGANVTLRPAVDSQIVYDRAIQNTITGGEGEFELYNVGAGRLRVKVLAAGYPDYEREIDFEPGTPLEITLSSAPAALSGQVTAGGAPVEGALLVLSGNGANPAPVATMVTEANGAYRLDGFFVGNYTLSVEAPIGAGDNISRKTLAVTVEDENAVQDVEFKNLVTVRGKVTLRGKPVRRESGEAVTLLFRPDEPGPESKMVQVTPESTYSTQLEPGKYTISLEDREGQQVEIPASQSHTVNFEM